jgi:uncharacterized protein (DUF1697 family)
MPRYVAFLRGVSPVNAKMPELKRCFETAGFANVKTVLSSGNVVFDARSAQESSLEQRAENSMQTLLGRSFYTIVRRTDTLRSLLETDPYAAFAVPPNAKRVVSFLRRPMQGKLALPIESDGARILSMLGREVFTAYVPNERGPVFMVLIERVFGTNVTTRTLETVKKCAGA